MGGGITLEQSISLCLCVGVVISAVAQNLLQAASLSVFGHTSYLILPLTWCALLPLYSVPVLYNNVFNGGFLPEVRSRGIHRTFLFIGFCTASSSILEFLAFTRTPATLQASFSQLVIPFTVIFTIAANPSFTRIYSKLALFGCILVAGGAIAHMSLFFLTSPSNIPVENVFWNTMYLLAQIPTTWSLVTQQQMYSTRRLNVFYFLLNVGLTQFTCALIFLPINCIKGIDSFALSNLRDVLRDFTSCVMNVSGLPSDRLHSMCNVAPHLLFLLLLVTFAAQMLQIMLVRRISYSGAATTILAIPTSIFVLQHVVENFDVFGPRITALLRFGEAHTSLVAELFPYLFILTGAVLFRLDPKNGLDRDFVVPPDPFLHASPLFAPILQSGDKSVDFGLCEGGPVDVDQLLPEAHRTMVAAGDEVHAPAPSTDCIDSKQRAGRESTKRGRPPSATNDGNPQQQHDNEGCPKPSGDTDGHEEGRRRNTLSFSSGQSHEHRDKEQRRQSASVPPENAERGRITGSGIGERTQLHVSRHETGASSPASSLNAYEILKMTEVDARTLGKRHNISELEFAAAAAAKADGDHLIVAPYRFGATIPFPRGTEDDLPPILRPVLMNVWCGSIPCEYTDYKRHLDYPSRALTLEDSRRPSVDRWYMRQFLSENTCAFGTQYTIKHMTSLGNQEALLRKLYAYHRFGTRGAFLVECGESPDEVGLPDESALWQ